MLARKRFGPIDDCAHGGLMFVAMIGGTLMAIGGLCAWGLGGALFGIGLFLVVLAGLAGALER